MPVSMRRTATDPVDAERAAAARKPRPAPAPGVAIPAECLPRCNRAATHKLPVAILQAVTPMPPAAARPAQPAPWAVRSAPPLKRVAGASTGASTGAANAHGAGSPAACPDRTDPAAKAIARDTARGLPVRHLRGGCFGVSGSTPKTSTRGSTAPRQGRAPAASPKPEASASHRISARARCRSHRR